MTATGAVVLGIAIVLVLVAARADLTGARWARTARIAARLASLAAGGLMVAIIVTEAL